MIKKTYILTITVFFALFLQITHLQLAFADAVTSSITTTHTKVTLISSVSQAKVNEYFWLGLKFENQPGWHIYYKNPGDSGLAPKIIWDTPTLEADQIEWPTPEKLPLGPLVNYGYSGEVLLPVKAKVTSSSNSSIEIKAQVSWLICMEDCIPEKGVISLTLPTSQEQSTASNDAKYINRSIESLPKPSPRDTYFEISKEGEDILLQMPSELSANKF
jgi:DsbC/DsbD-like thiol-disulfide interchange protein